MTAEVLVREAGYGRLFASYDMPVVEEDRTSAIRYSFTCPVCRNANDGEIVITAHSRRNAEVLVSQRTLTCDFCNAEVPAKRGNVKAEAA